MTGTELLRRRTQFGISIEDLAELLHAPVTDVRRYEQNAGQLPGGVTRRLEYFLAWQDQNNKLKAAGFDGCPGLDEVFAGTFEGRRMKAEELTRRAEQHTAGCERCQARIEFLKGLPALPPVPISPWLRTIFRVMDWFKR